MQLVLKLSCCRVVQRHGMMAAVGDAGQMDWQDNRDMAGSGDFLFEQRTMLSWASRSTIASMLTCGAWRERNAAASAKLAMGTQCSASLVGTTGRGSLPFEKVLSLYSSAMCWMSWLLPCSGCSGSTV